MDVEKYLILLKGTDRTGEITSLRREENKIAVTFASGAKYLYSRNNIVIYKEPIIMTPDEGIFFVRGKRIHGVKKAQIFEAHIRLFYTPRGHQTFEKDKIKLIKSGLIEKGSKDCFNYLKTVARICDIKNSGEDSILGKYYDKINFVREDSILAAFLNAKEPREEKEKLSAPIYPFGFNISQRKAVELALKKPLSLIEGPPETGKTQTILNIIANAIINNKSVAVVADNNPATANVLEKLQKNDVGFIAAFLGSNENKNDFINNQKGIPDISAWEIEKREKYHKEKIMRDLFISINDMLKQKNMLSKLKLEFENIKIEKSYFDKYYDKLYDNKYSLKSFRKINSKKALKLWMSCENYSLKNKNLGIFAKIKIFLNFGINDNLFYKLPLEKIISICQNYFYEQSLFEFQEKIIGIEKRLTTFSINDKLREYTKLSMEIFRGVLFSKYKKYERKHYNIQDLKENSNSFIKDYPIILSTTYSLINSLSNDFIYDYVIIDEASQVNLTTGALALSCAKRAVIVGDLKQLPNVVTEKDIKISNYIFNKYSLPEYYNYSCNSILQSIIKIFPEVPRTLLQEHYRCHPKIIEFCNQKFYNDSLIILTEDECSRKPLMVYETAPGNHARERLNLRQIEVIKNEIFPQQKLNPKVDSIGIVTPYRDQANKLQSIFGNMGVTSDTVDKFQGRENDIIIISTVDNKITPFTDDPNRLNVAISRASKQLILLVHGNKGDNNTNINDLIQYIKYNNLDIFRSEIYSVFDYLFKAYADERKKFLENKKRISQYDSENLMYSIIHDVLRQERFYKYGVSTHIPLRMILQDLDRLDEKEFIYATNPLTHIDFLIFNKLGKTPVMAIEVDGVSFHKQEGIQAERDMLKNSILQKYNLPIMRFRTDESREHDRLEEALENI